MCHELTHELLCPSRRSGGLFILVLILTVLQLSDGSCHANASRADGLRRFSNLWGVCGVQVTGMRLCRAAQST